MGTVDVLGLVSDALASVVNGARKSRADKIRDLKNVLDRADVQDELRADSGLLTAVSGLTSQYGFKLRALKAMLLQARASAAPQSMLLSDIPGFEGADLPDALVTPAGYQIEDNGYVTGIIDQPIAISAIFEVLGTQQERVEITFKSGDRWDKVTCPTSFLASKGKLAGFLASYGVAVHAGNDKAVSQYLTDFRTANASTLKAKPYTEIFWTDTQTADLLLLEGMDDCRYVTDWRSFIAWDGTRFSAERASQKLFSMYQDLLTKMRAEVDKLPKGYDREQFYEWLRNSESQARFHAACALLANKMELAVTSEDLDADPWKLNVGNGLLDLETGQLVEHAKRHLTTKITPVRFDPSAKCPLWEATIARIFADQPELVTYMQTLFGYCLTGLVKEQKLWFLLGLGGNGKTILMEILAKLLGEYAKPSDSTLLLAKRHDAHPTAIAYLYRLRLTIASEPPANRAWDEPTVKRLTGGDTITARKMRQDNWSFKPTHKIMVAANEPIIVHGRDEGIWRRLQQIPFNQRFHEGAEGYDPAIGDKLQAELSGILNWALVGLDRYRREGLQEPESIKAATATYRAEQDVFAHFIDDCLIVDFEQSVRRIDLYQVYQRWCRLNNENPLKNKSFYKEIRKLPVKDRKSNGMEYFDGLGIKQEWTNVALGAVRI